VTFELKKFATQMELLPVGNARARVRFWPDPMSDRKYFSPYCDFKIVK
jgi:hypothetical protein